MTEQHVLPWLYLWFFLQLGGLSDLHADNVSSGYTLMICSKQNMYKHASYKVLKNTSFETSDYTQ